MVRTMTSAQVRAEYNRLARDRRLAHRQFLRLQKACRELRKLL